jgi:hypothetical protein
LDAWAKIDKRLAEFYREKTMKQRPRRVFSAEEKAELLTEYDGLPQDGARGQFMKKNRFGWMLMNRWRNDPAVKAAMRNGTIKPPPQRIHVSDLPELNLPTKEDGVKRQFTLHQKADILAQFDALPHGSDERGEFMKKYGVFWGMLNRWRHDLKLEGIPIPNLKLGDRNGDAEIPDHPPRRGGARSGAGRPKRFVTNQARLKAALHSAGRFETAEDTIAWLDIRIEEATKIREELKQHVGKTRNE